MIEISVDRVVSFILIIYFRIPQGSKNWNESERGGEEENEMKFWVTGREDIG
jgi:hypothetical protein